MITPSSGQTVRIEEGAVVYENLAFRRFRVFGDAPRLVGRVDATSSPHVIRGLEIEDIPEALTLSVAGKVEWIPKVPGNGEPR